MLEALKEDKITYSAINMSSPAIKIENDLGDDDEVTRILESIPDPNGIITDNFAATAQSLVRDIKAERKALAVPLYEPVALRIFLNELERVALDTRGETRDDGSSYFQDHLVGTVRHLIHDQARTGVVTLVSGLRHDSTENQGQKPEDLVRYDEYGVSNGDLPERLRNIRQDVATIVDGVSKIRNLPSVGELTREGTRNVTFSKFLRTALTHGPRVIHVKEADRTHNMKTLKGHRDLDKQKDIALETERIYVPMAEIIGIRVTVASLVDSCLQELNPEILAHFEKLRQQRLDVYMKPYVSTLVDRFEGVRPLLVGDPRFNTVPISKFVLKQETPFERLRLEDLDISPTEPMFEIAIIIDPLAEIDDVVAFIMKNFSGSGMRAEVIYPHYGIKSARGGAIVKIHSQKFEHPIIFRINDSVSEARAKRGLFADFDDNIPEGIRGAISGVLRQTYKKGGGVKGDIVAVARKELLRPTITVYTIAGRMVHLQKGSTVLDFVAEAHHPLFVHRALAAKASYHIFDVRFEKVDLLDPLQDDTVVSVDLADEDTPITIDPGWILFCHNEKAREALRDNIFRKDGKPDTEIMACGQAYIQKLSKLFGLQEDEVYAVLAVIDGNKTLTKDKINKKIGRTVELFEPVRVLSETVLKDRKQWTFVVSLENKAGELHRFLGDFRRHGINLEDLSQAPSHERSQSAQVPEGAQKQDVQFSFDSPEKLSVLEIMKIFLKLSYRYSLKLGKIERLQFDAASFARIIADAQSGTI